jgi:hypothetical protein
MYSPMWSSAGNNGVTEFSSEKEIAAELSRLRRQVRQLREEIRGGALPSKTPVEHPVLPTEPERRLRPIRTADEDEDE